jgi:GT2 family glycosyltransferase
VLDSKDVDVRLIVVDDLPGDPDVARFVQNLQSVTLIVPPMNLGFATAVNWGIAVGDAPYVLLLNQDARLEPEALSFLSARLGGDPGLAAVGGRVLYQATPDLPPDGTIDSAGIGFRRGRRSVDIGQGELDIGQFDGWREVFGICAAVALYRRSALQKIADDGQILDESFYMQKEDVDLAWRLRRAGYRAGVDGRAVAFHARGTRRALDADVVARHPLTAVRTLIAAERAKATQTRRLAWRNQMRMLIKNDTAAGLRRSLPWLLLHQLGYAAAGLALDPIGTIVDRIWIVSHLPLLLASRTRSGRRHLDLPRWLP